jgi:hypothetical protein
MELVILKKEMRTEKPFSLSFFILSQQKILNYIIAKDFSGKVAKHIENK